MATTSPLAKEMIGGELFAAFHHRPAVMVAGTTLAIAGSLSIKMTAFPIP